MTRCGSGSATSAQLSAVRPAARPLLVLLLGLALVALGACGTAVEASSPEGLQPIVDEEPADAALPIIRRPVMPLPSLPAPAPVPAPTSSTTQAPHPTITRPSTTQAPTTTAPTTTRPPTTAPPTTAPPVPPVPGVVWHVAVDGPANGDGSAARPFPSMELGPRADGPGET